MQIIISRLVLEMKACIACMAQDDMCIPEMQWSLWPNPQHQALLQTCCSQSCSSAGWLSLKHTEEEKSERGFSKRGNERGERERDRVIMVIYIDTHTVLYVKICAVFLEFQSFPQKSSGNKPFSTQRLVIVT